MLDPNHRSLFTTLLTPPAGMVFDTGLATTFSLDPLSLLTVPLHLAWLANHGEGAGPGDPVRLLEALQRVTERLTVFADRGRILVPGQANALFALLERTIVEVRAPRGGAFHPKLWVLRFVHPERPEEVVLRLGILSRNLTSDRCWDLSLVLEGRPTGAYVGANRPLGELIAQIPGWAVNDMAPSRRAQTAELADEVRRTKWELPGQWEDLAFHVIGTRRGGWNVGAADDLAVISPFLSPDALAQLGAGKGRRMALVSRPECLAGLSPEVRAQFDRCLVLDDAAETEDGEAPPHQDDVGLHAKAVILRRGWYSHLFVGSANATNAAMVAGTNVEVMAELIGRHSQVGRVETLLEKGNLGGVLTDFDPQTPMAALDAARAAAEAALERCQRELAKAELGVRCASDGDGNYRLHLCVTSGIPLAGVAPRAWPLSLQPDLAVPADALATGAKIELGVVDAADVTGLIGFELTCDGQTRRFALNLPVEGLPTERDAAILRRVVRNREGFMRYLRLLLGGMGANLDAGQTVGTGTQGSWQMGSGNGLDSLLEDMVRAWSREPERLRDVQRVVERLRGHQDEAGPIIPPEFDALWKVFEQALGDTP
jgi:hypothetical protein